MSEPESRNSHPFQWGVAVVTLLPMVYILGCGPLMAWTHDKSLAKGWPDWVYWTCKPIAWLRTDTPLAEPLGKYYDWWLSK
jgi:hypothetical protein